MFEQIVQGTDSLPLLWESLHEVVRCVFESATCSFEYIGEDVQKCFYCYLLHRRANLFRENAFRFANGHFAHCVFYFRGDQRVRDGWVDSQCRSLYGSFLERRALGIWLKSGIKTSFRYLHCFAFTFRLMEGRWKRWVGAIPYDAFRAGCSRGQFWVGHVWFCITIFLVAGHVFPNYRALVRFEACFLNGCVFNKLKVVESSSIDGYRTISRLRDQWKTNVF